VCVFYCAVGQVRGGTKHPAEIANLLVRHILSSRAPLTNDQWQRTVEHFGSSCAYCGTAQDDSPEKDHAIPINRDNMGEHTAANVVPVCKECNGLKHARDYREFLADKPEQLAKIDRFMEEAGCQPLRDSDSANKMRALLNEAYDDAKDMVAKYARLLGVIAGDSQ
jgi:hypothetical protein